MLLRSSRLVLLTRQRLSSRSASCHVFSGTRTITSSFSSSSPSVFAYSRKSTRFFSSASSSSSSSSASKAAPADAADADNTNDNSKEPVGGWKERLLQWGSDENLYPRDAEKFKRLWMVPFSMANHLCLGAVFAWSIFNEPLTKLNGVLVSSSMDWVLGDVSLTFSLIMGGFFWGALLGKHLDRLGPRISCLIGAACLGSGYGLAALAVQTQTLPLLYVGGAVWGLANGWAYVPPVANLLKWFPAQKGFASGAVIVGFGGGAAIAAPAYTWLLHTFRRAPEYIGKASEVVLENINGVPMWASRAGGELREVVVAAAADVQGWDGLSQGVYLVGTGSSGAVETFAIMGAVYSTVMIVSALCYRVPGPKDLVLLQQQASAVASTTAATAPVLTTHNVSVSNATKSRQFWLMWTGFGLSVTGSYGIISCGKTMLLEIFGAHSPLLVTSSFAALFVSLMSLGNLGGRAFWSNMSDWIAKKKGGDPLYGRKMAFALMWGLGPPLYMAVVWATHNLGAANSVLPLTVFCIAVTGIMSSFGGTAASRPAFTSDLWGTKNVGTLTARQLSSVLPASYFGPKIATHFRQSAIDEHIVKLSELISEDKFIETFGRGKDELELLLQAKSITIQRMLELCPPGTVDPTPFCYDQTMYVMAALQLCAFATNALVTPMDKSLHMVEDTANASQDDANTEEAEIVKEEEEEEENVPAK